MPFPHVDDQNTATLVEFSACIDLRLVPEMIMVHELPPLLGDSNRASQTPPGYGQRVVVTN
jgi:hypothetical protein